jgi:hypothetical protein
VSDSTFQLFLRLRFEFASLVWDAWRAFWENRPPWHARLACIPVAVFMLALPVAVLWAGNKPFGDEFAFGLTLLVWPILLEAPSWSLRQSDARRSISGVPDAPLTAASGFDVFRYILLTAIGIATPVMLNFFASDVARKEFGQVWLGVLWGIAIAAGIDLARTIVALFLAVTRGYPMYRA